MHTFHSLLAALWLESLKPIVLSNCSYWRREKIESQRDMWTVEVLKFIVPWYMQYILSKIKTSHNYLYNEANL